MVLASPLRAVGWGLLCGLAFGVLARIWMRLIAVSPEFTWEGTLSIVIASCLFWTVAFVVAQRASVGGAKAWALLMLLGLGMFSAQGVTLFPGAFAASLWTCRSVPRGVQRAGLIGVIAATGWVWSTSRFDEATYLFLPLTKQALVVVGYAAMAWALGAAIAWVWELLLRRPPAPGRVTTRHTPDSGAWISTRSPGS